ncbi:MAG: glutamine-hydrolyzing GMP synthase [Bacteroidota bacterium]|nr:glutamine-hydrolyzing GMP synthase [Bacteroidota bacterium]
MQRNEIVLVLDFGSQYTQLIARRIREIGVYSEIHPYNIPLSKIKEIDPKSIIFSGGPSNVYQKNAPKLSPEIYKLNIPILGICYGLQLIAHQLGGEVDRSAKREYGKVQLFIDDISDLFFNFEKQTNVWMSHGDALIKLPSGFEKIAHTNNSPFCVIRDESRKIYGVQFHPEVIHTEKGIEIIRNFVLRICGCKSDWSTESFIKQKTVEIRNVVGSGKVICALSGGVDSSVLAVMMHKAIGDTLFCFHIDNGLMRKDESEEVVRRFKDEYKINLDYIDASKIFLERLKGVENPELKRKIIGHTFIDIFEEEARKLGDIDFLAQGTLYPDAIESQSFKGPSATIKSHHNVGGLPEKMKLKLIEPLRELFKDEVRAVGSELGLPHDLLYRHPFPGPGLAVRIIGEITIDKLEILRNADYIFIEELKISQLYDLIWQAFAVLLPVQSVGVMGDERTYENVIALRAVTSVDGMTADWFRMPQEILEKISSRIINEVTGVNRVVYDISSKPPATIEWE